MNDLLENLHYEDAVILTAPPGWGKTYRLLAGLKKTKRKAIFIFPLRALCDEVFLSASKLGINVCNLRNKLDQQMLGENYFDLVITTPECISEDIVEGLAHEYLFIVDEAHLFYYWGKEFRPALVDCMQWVFTYSPAVMFLSATLNQTLLKKLESDLNYNYQNIYQLDFGNQMLKNLPSKLYFYPPHKKIWILDDIKFSHCDGVKLVFCPYRKQVKSLGQSLSKLGLKVLCCVGGEASEFTARLQTETRPDVIIATSVVSHGVNLPAISKVYFLYQVENLDFYLQMVGRGGREQNSFELHTLNFDYFPKRALLKGLGRSHVKRIRNKLNSLL